MMAGPSGAFGQQRGNPFVRNSSVPPATSNGNVNGRPKSVLFSNPAPTSPGRVTHSRSQSALSPSAANSPFLGSVSRPIYGRSREGTPASGTFAPSFINTDELKQRSISAVHGIEGENDFSGKRYVWLKDPQKAFVKGWVVEDQGNNRLVVQCEDGSVSLFPSLCML